MVVSRLKQVAEISGAVQKPDDANFVGQFAKEDQIAPVDHHSQAG